MTAGVRTTTATVYRALYHTDGDTSVNLCMDDEDEEKRTERNRIYLYVAVNLKQK